MPKSTRIDTVPWEELSINLSTWAHDDLRDIQTLLFDVEALKRAGVNHRITTELFQIGNKLAATHMSFRDFRTAKQLPARKEIGQYLREYKDSLLHAKELAETRIRELKPEIERISDPHLNALVSRSVNQIRMMSKIGNTFLHLKGGNNLRLGRYSLRRIVGEVVGERVIDREGNAVNVIIHGGNAHALCDKRLVVSSVKNLLTDATHHTPGRPIHVAIGKAGGFATISVTSQGPQLTPREIAIIGRERYTRSLDSSRGWGKISVRINSERQNGWLKADNSELGPRLTIGLQEYRRPARTHAA